MSESKTYYFGFTDDAKLIVVRSDIPEEDAVRKTGETIKLFGWREGILHTINQIEEYLKTGQLQNAAERIKLNSRPKQMPNGDVYDACAACGHSPAADQAMWEAVVLALDLQLATPPEVAYEDKQ